MTVRAFEVPSTTQGVILRRIAIIASLVSLVGIVPATTQATTSAPASKQDRATYLGVRHAAKKAGVRVGPKIAKRAHSAHSHAVRTRVMRAELRAKHARVRATAAAVNVGILPACADESAGDYSTGPENTNPSTGATGRWQEVPMHRQKGGLCYGLDLSPRGQDACAVRIFRAQGSGAWTGCG